jgi:hypothetical protein
MAEHRPSEATTREALQQVVQTNRRIIAALAEEQDRLLATYHHRMLERHVQQQEMNALRSEVDRRLVNGLVQQHQTQPAVDLPDGSASAPSDSTATETDPHSRRHPSPPLPMDTGSA